MKFKKIILGAIIAAALSANCYAQDINVSLNGEIIAFANQKPVVVEGRTLIPLRGVFDNMGYAINWDGATKTVTLTKDANTISISIGASSLSLNGVAIALDVPAQIINGNTMLPLRAIADATGAEVLWDNETKIATILDQSTMQTGAQYKNVMIDDQQEADFVKKYTAINEEYNKTALEFMNFFNEISTAGVTSEDQIAEMGEIANKMLDASTKAKSSLSALSCPSEYAELKTVSIEYMQALSDLSQLLIDMANGNIDENFEERFSSIATDAVLKEAAYQKIFANINN